MADDPNTLVTPSAQQTLADHPAPPMPVNADVSPSDANANGQNALGTDIAASQADLKNMQPSALPSGESLYIDPNPENLPAQPVVGRGPATLPWAVKQRLAKGQVLDDVISGAVKGLKQGYGSGDDPVGIQPGGETEKWLQENGMLFTPGDTSYLAPLRAFNDSLIRNIAGLGDAFFRTLGATPSTVEGAAKPVVGPGAARDLGALSEYALFSGDIGNFHVAGPKVVDGKFNDAQIGSPYTGPDDFRKTAVILDPAGKNAPLVNKATPDTWAKSKFSAEAILQRLHQENGVTPQEVGVHAQTDPQVTQPIAAGQIPEVYGGDQTIKLQQATANGPEKIVSAAIVVDGRTFIGQTHGDAIMAAEDAGVAAPKLAALNSSATDRFLTSNGNVVTREEATGIASKAEQQGSLDTNGNLRSEGTLAQDKNELYTAQSLEYYRQFQQVPREITAEELTGMRQAPVEAEPAAVGAASTPNYKFAVYDKRNPDGAQWVFPSQEAANEFIAGKGEDAQHFDTSIPANTETKLPDRYRYIAQREDGSVIASNNRDAFDLEVSKLPPDENVKLIPGNAGGSGGEPPREGGTGAGYSPDEGGLAKAQDAIKAQIDSTNHDKVRPWTWNRIYSTFVDQLHPIKVAVQNALKEIGGGTKLEVSRDPYALYRLAKGSAGKADNFLEYNTRDFKTYAVNGESLKTIMAPVQEDLANFNAYAVSKRALELQAQGKESGMDIEAASRIANDPKQRAQYDAVLKQLVGFQNRLTQYLRDSGLLSKDGYNAMLAMNKDYVPFYRWMNPELFETKKVLGGGRGAGAGLGARNPLKRFEGFDAGIINPIESIIKNTYVYIALAEKNAAAQKLIQFLTEADKRGFYASDVTAGGAPARIEPTLGTGTVRLYKGGEAGQGVHFTNDRTYAQGYADKSGGVVQYVDVPLDHPAIEMPDLANGTTGNLNNVELPAEDAAHARTLEPGSTAAKWADGEDGHEGSAPEGALIKQTHEPTVIDGEFQHVLDDYGVDEIGNSKLVSKELQALVETAARPEAGEGIHAFFDGKRETYLTSDPELLAAFRGMDKETIGVVTKILSLPAKGLRAGAVLNPEFLAKNGIRDFFGAVVNSKGAIFSPLDTLKGAVAQIQKGETYSNWLAGGGANAALVSVDRRYIQEQLFKLGTETGLFRNAWNVVTSPIRALRLASEFVENSTRIGEFIKQGGGVKAATEADKAAIQSASFDSREVTVDFARRGSQMAAANMITAFFNANVQGVDRLARAMITNPKSTALKIAIGITAPSVYLWAHNHNDPRYQNLPQWQKDLFWIFPTNNWVNADHKTAGQPDYYYREGPNGQLQRNDGIIYRGPKPFETGVIFGSGVERILDAIAGNDPHWETLGSDIAGALLPSFIPTFAAPIIQQMSNTDFAGNTLIPGRLESQMPEYQYQPYTTQAARKLAQLFGAFPGIKNFPTVQDAGIDGIGVAKALTSPILIENYIKSWTGGLGDQAFHAADAFLRTAGALPNPPQPAMKLTDIPVVKAFVVRYPAAGMQPIDDFFSQQTRNKEILDTMNAQAKAGDGAAYKRILSEQGIQVDLSSFAKVISEQGAIIRMVNDRPTPAGMTDEQNAQEKRQIIDTAYWHMLQIAQAGNKVFDQLNAARKQTPDALPKGEDIYK